MLGRDDLEKQIDRFFSGQYEIKSGLVVPEIADIHFGKKGREMELAMLFIDIRESTKIVGGFRRTTAARMYKSFLWGVSKIARENDGELRSFNGDGVLVVFNGDGKRTNAVRAALQMKWFCQYILKPKVDAYFQNNKQLEDMDFNFGIGVDVGNILIVRGGIKGENNNDLVWVGNATNYAVKLSSLSVDGYHVHISKDVYDKINKTSKLNDDFTMNMWERRIWTARDNEVVYRSNWYWKID